MKIGEIKKYLKDHPNITRIGKIVSVFLVAYLSIFLFVQDPRFRNYIDIIKGQGLRGQLFFIAYFASTIIITPIPATPLKVIAILTWGFWPAYILVLTGDVVGGMISFSISRLFGRKFVKRYLGTDRFERMNKIIDTKSLRSIFELRMTSNFSYDYVSYALGLTDVKIKTYFLTTLMAKMIWMFIILSVISRAVYIQDDPIGILIVALYAIGIVYLGSRFKSRLNKK